jgi:hypothetical protein
VLAIMIILIGVLALVVVNAMFGSPWATSTVTATIPIAIAMGLYMTLLRPGACSRRRSSASRRRALAVFAGRWIDQHEALRVFFDLDKKTLALALIGYGFTASVLPCGSCSRRATTSRRSSRSARWRCSRRAARGAPARAAARAHAVHRRQRARVRGQAVPVLLHHDRVRRDLGFHSLISSAPRRSCSTARATRAWSATARC